MLFVEKEIRRDDQALAYAPGILLRIMLFFSVPDETGGFEKDQVPAHSLTLCRL